MDFCGAVVGKDLEVIFRTSNEASGRTNTQPDAAFNSVTCADYFL